MPNNSQFLLYSNRSAPTGRELARVLNIGSGASLERRVDTLIRWGSTASVRYRPGTTLNGRDAVANAVDKFASLGIMRESGVPAPRVIDDPESHFGQWDTACAIVGRTRQHHAGNGWWLCHNTLEVQKARNEGAHHFVPFYPLRDEYRVHIAGGEPFRVQRKIAGDEVSSYTVRNTDNGWSVFRVNTWPDEIVDPAVRAVGALGLDFGAVDIAITENGRPVVFEVNTAPAQDEHGLEAYRDRFAQLLGG